MAETNKLVIIISRGLDDERSSVAWSISNGGIASGMDVTIFLVASGIEWVRKGAAEHARPNPLDPPIKEMMGNLINGGGRILACPPCTKVRGLGQEDLIDGVVLAGSVAMLEEVKKGAAVVTL